MDPAAETAARETRLAALPFAPAAPAVTFWRGGASSPSRLWGRRELIGLLVRRELKSRYRDSTGGFLWTLGKPLAQLLLFYLVIGRFLGAERAIHDFAIYVFAGLTLWGLFGDIITWASPAVLANGSLVKKVGLPREVFPLAYVGSAFVNFAVQTAILLIAAALAGTLRPGIHLLYGIAALGIALVWGIALALFLAATTVYLRDLAHLMEVLLPLLMWASPIVYGWRMVADEFPAITEFYLANPMSLAVIAWHQAVWDPAATVPDGFGLRLALAFLAGLVALWIGHRVFNRLEGDFAQEL